MGAAANGRADIVSMLLQRSDVNSSATDEVSFV